MQQYSWQSHDIKVFFGDMNFRNLMNLEMETAMKLIEQDDIQSLQFYDEFVNFQQAPKVKKGILRNYKEGTITFAPTYKFHMGTSDYDWSRMPAYCDRILFESVHDLPQRNPLMNIYYGCVDFELSDHKPVVGMFEAKIKVVNEDLKEKVTQKIREKFNEQGVDTEDQRKEKFLNFFEGPRNWHHVNKDDFAIDHFPEGLSNAFADTGEMKL